MLELTGGCSGSTVAIKTKSEVTTCLLHFITSSAEWFKTWLILPTAEWIKQEQSSFVSIAMWKRFCHCCCGADADFCRNNSQRCFPSFRSYAVSVKSFVLPHLYLYFNVFKDTPLIMMLLWGHSCSVLTFIQSNCKSTPARIRFQFRFGLQIWFTGFLIWQQNIGTFLHQEKKKKKSANTGHYPVRCRPSELSLSHNIAAIHAQRTKLNTRAWDWTRTTKDQWKTNPSVISAGGSDRR